MRAATAPLRTTSGPPVGPEATPTKLSAFVLPGDADAQPLIIVRNDPLPGSGVVSWIQVGRPHGPASPTRTTIPSFTTREPN